jgi:hypothetical protein
MKQYDEGVKTHEMGCNIDKTSWIVSKCGETHQNQLKGD